MDLIVLIAILAVLTVFVGFGWASYNTLIKARNAVEQAESDIDTFLKRRHNVIPGVLESVKEYMRHEEKVLTKVTEARSQAMQVANKGVNSDARVEQENMLTGALKSLFAVSENYPDLKAVEPFLRLKQALIDAEDKIAAQRRFYNSHLRNYIDKTQLFPLSIVASVFGFRVQAKYFDVTEAEAAPIKIKF